MSNSGDASPKYAYLEGFEDAAAGKWYNGAYIFNNPSINATEDDPSLCVETLYRRFRRALEMALGSAVVQDMVVLRALNTIYTNGLVKQPHMAVRLLHNTDATFGLRLLSYSSLNEQVRRAPPTQHPVELDHFGPHLDPVQKPVVESFTEMAHRAGLVVKHYTRKEGDILLASGMPHLQECCAYGSIVELVFARPGYRAFRQLGHRGPDPVRETFIP